MAHKADEANILIERLKGITIENLSEYCWLIQNLPIKWSTNTMLSPKLYKHLESTGELLNCKILYLAQKELDFNDYQNFNLINIFNE